MRKNKVFTIDEETSVIIGAGVRTITEERIKRQSKQANNAVIAAEFPTKHVPIVEFTARTGENCQGGMGLYFDAIDKCQHFATCGFCVDSSRISTSNTLKKRVVGISEVFDTVAYAEKVAKKTTDCRIC